MISEETNKMKRKVKKNVKLGVIPGTILNNVGSQKLPVMEEKRERLQSGKKTHL